MFQKLTLIIVVIFAAAMVQAEGVYVGGGVNYTSINDAQDSGLSIEALGGMALGKVLRGELSVSYDREDIGTQDVTIWEFFGNLYYDFRLESKIRPYVLGGVGYGNVSSGSLFGSSSRDGAFLGQVGGGLALPLGEKMLLDIKYRYQFSQDYKLSNTSSFQLTAHQVGVGVRYMF